jgi:hypothetical protein
MSKKNSGVALSEATTPDTELQSEGVDNSADALIELQQPYTVHVKLKGTADLMFHRYNVEEVKAKSEAPKGSKIKKTDNVEAYIWRNQDGKLCIPGEYLRMACVETGRSHQDPRSKRKSARDLFKAVILCLTDLAPIKTAAGDIAEEWDYVDKRRVTVQRSAVTRARPVFRQGWEAEFDLMVLSPEHLPPATLQLVLNQAGLYQGVGDFRPTFGRFAVTEFSIIGPEMRNNPNSLFSG